MQGSFPLMRGFPHTANISTNNSQYNILGKSLDTSCKLRKPAGVLNPLRVLSTGGKQALILTPLSGFLVDHSAHARDHIIIAPSALYPDFLFY